MNELDHIRTFLAIVETGSFTKAANRLAITKSVASRRLTALETNLETRLLTRTTRGVSPTTAGVAFFEQAQRILGELEDAKDAARAERQELAGLIRLAAPKTFGRLFIQPVLLDILATYPKIILDLNFSDRRVDIAGEGYDLGLRIGKLPDSSLIARKLADIRLTLVASPAYLAKYGEPQTPDDLTEHNCFIYTNRRDSHYWTFGSGKNAKSVRVDGTIRTNSGDMQVAACLAGLGIAAIPHFNVSEHLKAGRLKHIMCPHQQGTVGLYAVYPETRHLTGRVRRLIDILAERFSDPALQDQF